ncbi:uncharacterized protein LOC108913539 [Anoplophora glabripennis]|nr:uncharacterized protein LOC108913539 [Anoplophora glabripennis]
MALVSYDYDSDSENEVVKEEVIDLSAKIKVNSIASISQTDSAEERSNKDTEPLFATLPYSKNIVKNFPEEQIEDFIPKSKPIRKDKEKVKITIPCLSDFNDVNDDEPQIKKQKQSVKGSSLISLLPPVKGSVTTAKSFVPTAVNKKNIKDTTKCSTLIPHKVRKKVETNQMGILRKKGQNKEQDNDAESDDDIEMPETFDDEMWKKICGRPKVKPVVHEPEWLHDEIINIAPEAEKPYNGLDNQAFKELVGRNKRPIGNIKLIDINEEEILPEKDIWMAKSLTDPEMASKPKIEDPVDPTRRKKHHITYLAQQAKANEQELQNAWAASKNSRLASRAKYGF